MGDPSKVVLLEEMVRVINEWGLLGLYTQQCSLEGGSNCLIMLLSGLPCVQHVDG